MDQFTLHSHVVDGVTLVVAEGELDLSQSSALRTTLRQALEHGPGSVIVDLTDVALIDAAIMGVLAVLLDQAAQSGRTLRAVGASGTVLDVLEMVGLAKPLQVHLPRTSAPPRPAMPCCTGHARSPREVIQDAAGGEPDLSSMGNVAVGELLAEAAALPVDDARRGPLRARAIELALPAAHRMAARYRNRGENDDDLRQVAAIGLLKAIDGWDPERGHAFSDYAVPTILGELRRYFRDRGWAMRVPRRIKEVLLETRRVNDQLTQELGRDPGAPDLAGSLGIPTKVVEAALHAAQAYRPRSLSLPVGDGSAELGEMVGAPDPRYESIDDWTALADVIANLPERTRRILSLRFVAEMSQSQIAAEVGLSQMHVSRILSQTMATLHAALTVTE